MKLRIPVLAATLALVLAACGSGNGGTGTPTGGDTTALRLSVLPVVGTAPLFLAQEKGDFADAGLDVTTAIAQTGAASMAELMGGNADIGFASPVPVLVGQTRGLPVQIACGATAEPANEDDQSVALVVAKGGNVADVAGLAGRTVAVNALQAADHLVTTAALTRAGVDPTSVSFVQMAYPDMLGALQRGDVDAAVVIEPFLTAGAENTTIIARPNAEYGVDGTSAVYVTTTEFAQNNAATIRSFCEVIASASDFANENQDDARAVIGTYTEIPDALRANMRLLHWTADVNTESLQKLADDLVQAGFVPQAPDVAAVWK